jgi:hypothetical protein
VVIVASACSGDTAGSTCGNGTRLENGVCVAGFDASGGISGSGGVMGASSAATGGGGSGASGGADAGSDASASGGSGAGTVQDASPDSLCAGARVPLTPVMLPVDLIWAVDASGSMLEEATAVQESVNSVVQAISASGVDIHVVMLASRPECLFDGGFCLPGICVPAPLGSGRCPDDSKPPSFFHHPTAVVNSNDAALVFVRTFPDYKSTLRASAQKHLFVITDDDSTGTQAGVYADNAARFIADYTALDPMLADSPSRGRVWRLSAMYAASVCPNALRIGQVWKNIVDQTGGVHADICSCVPDQQQGCAQAVRQWSDAVAKLVTMDAQPAECEWAIPPPPPGQLLYPELISIELTDASGGNTILRNVSTATSCGAEAGWYFDNPANPRTILACPATCDVIKATRPQVSMHVRCRSL